MLFFVTTFIIGLVDFKKIQGFGIATFGKKLLVNSTVTSTGVNFSQDNGTASEIQGSCLSGLTRKSRLVEALRFLGAI